MTKHRLQGNISAKGQGFDKNKQNINRKGQPRKGLAFVNEQLKEKGQLPATKQDVIVAYRIVINSDRKELETMVKDESTIMLFRILARAVLDGKRGFDNMERIIDRGMGKAQETLNIGGEVELSKESMDALKILIQQRNARRTSTDDSHGG